MGKAEIYKQIERELERFDRSTLTYFLQLLSSGIDVSAVREALADARQHKRFKPKPNVAA